MQVNTRDIIIVKYQHFHSSFLKSTDLKSASLSVSIFTLRVYIESLEKPEIKYIFALLFFYQRQRSAPCLHGLFL